MEKAERIELLRWLENGNELIPCQIVKETISVDTPNDLVKVSEFKLNQSNLLREKIKL